MQHRYWCSKCRNITLISSTEPAPTDLSVQCKCGTLATYLESVDAPIEVPRGMGEPTAGNPQRPPSREEWYDAGYAAGTYERRFAGPEWLPCWSDPKYVPKRFKLDEQGAIVPVTATDVDETETAPPVAPSIIDVDDEPDPDAFGHGR